MVVPTDVYVLVFLILQVFTLAALVGLAYQVGRVWHHLNDTVVRLVQVILLHRVALRQGSRAAAAAVREIPRCAPPPNAAFPGAPAADGATEPAEIKAPDEGIRITGRF